MTARRFDLARSALLAAIALGSPVGCHRSRASEDAGDPNAGVVKSGLAEPGRATTPSVNVDALLATLEELPVAGSTHNLIKNSTFQGPRTLPWMAAFTAPARGRTGIEHGALCTDVQEGGSSSSDVRVYHREMTLRQSHAYSIRLKIAATSLASAELRIGNTRMPPRVYWRRALALTPTPQVVDANFTMVGPDDETAEFVIAVGGGSPERHTPYTMCVDDVVLDDPTFTPETEAPELPISNLLVNQVGYIPQLQKVAILKTTSSERLPWELASRDGRVVASGTTEVHGYDAASGDNVQWVDFSSFHEIGSAYALRADGHLSHPFDVSPHVYRQLMYDALAFFYQNRSGIPIEMPYARDPKWTRSAGHRSDARVACAPDAHCTYQLDVSGGWYDAGDHGKYVVNGGISVWTLLSIYERARWLGYSADFADGTMSIPEGHNGVPDLLDEARWELEFLMKMQVPEGFALAGMVHHKVHGIEWTPLATRPDEDTSPRFLRPVSTAATLNLAAVAAQCARVFREVDPAFAARCQLASERAFGAAKEHPTMFIGANDRVGGGAYDDDDVSDEFAWAESELYATTRNTVYRDALLESPYRFAIPFDAQGQPKPMSWSSTASLGTISIALAANWLPAADVAAARDAIRKAADAVLATERTQGYRVGFTSANGFPWGSNALVLNNAILESLAYDFTRDPKYVDSVADALSYILGCNPNDQSYVTGYGSRPMEHPHHRFWSHQVNSAFPSPPPGLLAGGPNSGLDDPYGVAYGLTGCAPMKCYVDHSEAWSANEVAINWNAPLAWIAAFLDETTPAGTRRHQQ